MRCAALAAAVLLLLAAACGSTTTTDTPQVCTDACNKIFTACKFTSITVTDPNTGASTQVGPDGCTASCAALDRPTPYQCVVDDAVACTDVDHLSGCLSSYACVQTQLAVGGCYGSSPSTDGLAKDCIAHLSAWKSCIGCVSNRTCTQMRGECEGPCRVQGAGGSGGGGAGAGGAGGSGAGGS
jgi:hypothetical protein